jgi:hypothetical protein
MAIRPKLMMSAGIAIAGLGLIGAGAGATFTTQVSASSQITSGGVGLSLNGKTGTDQHLKLNGENLGSHFAPITKDLALKNTGTLNLASTYLSIKATGCDGSDGEALAKALHVRLTAGTSRDDKSTNHVDKVIYDGDLCSMDKSKSDQDRTATPAHTEVGLRLPGELEAGETTTYLLVIEPGDTEKGLPTDAQSTSTSVSLTFTGFDY